MGLIERTVNRALNDAAQAERYERATLVDEMVHDDSARATAQVSEILMAAGSPNLTDEQRGRLVRETYAALKAIFTAE